MKKLHANAEIILKQLGSLSSFLAYIDSETDKKAIFQYPLEIIHDTMFFDLSVLYKVSNIIESQLILEVVKVFDPKNKRPDFYEGLKISLILDNPDKSYINEVNAFNLKRVSHINVPGIGCDIVGYVYLPESFGGAYLFGGDFLGKESSIADYEVSAVEIMCNFLSSILLRTQFKLQAEYDHLTGIYTSRKIREEAQRLFKRFERKPDSQACLALGDIDSFKLINDTYSHIQGDLVLKKIGEILDSSMRGYFDIAGRYGGEEFLLVFDETDLEKTFAIVERIRKTIETTKFVKIDKSGKEIKNKFLNITISFGIAQLLNSYKDISEWISKADGALYDSKKNGKNQTSIYTPLIPSSKNQ